MYGMTTINAASLSNYEDRTIWIEFVNGLPQEHHSHQTLKVSYNRLSQTLQRIKRHGGKVIRITSASELDLPQPLANSQTTEKPATAAVKQEDKKTQSVVNPEQISEKNRKSTEKSARPSRRDKKSKHRR